MVNLPKPNQIDDLKRHMALKRKAESAARRGHELLKAGKRDEARAALEECEACMEQAWLIAERWK